MNFRVKHIFDSNVFSYIKVPKSIVKSKLRFEKMNGAGKNRIVSFIRFTLMSYSLNASITENRICL